jgi:Na+-driven multidrug efflux pump
MIVSGGVMWTCRVAVAVLMVRVFEVGLVGIWIGMFTDWLVRGILMGWRFKSGKWAKKSVVSA